MCVSWVPAKIVCKLNCIVNELFVCKLMAYRATPAHPRYFPGAPMHDFGGQTNFIQFLVEDYTKKRQCINGQ